jgi:branched-chain amino acid transport system substrate-binding protein
MLGFRALSMRRTAIFCAAGLCVVSLLPGCGSTSHKASAPGVTAKTIRIGLIFDETGPNASNSIGLLAAAQGRVAQENASGGVDGRQLQLVVADDQSSEEGNATAAEDLVNKGVFGVIDMSVLSSLGDKYLTSHSVPEVGTGVSGPEWGDPANRNLFAIDGSENIENVVNSWGNFFKQQGGTNVGIVAYNLPSTVSQAQELKDSSLAAGLKVGYYNQSITIGSQNWTATALSLKDARVNAVTTSLSSSDSLALYTAMKQEGVHAIMLAPALYGQTVLSDPATRAEAQGIFTTSYILPIEANTAASRKFHQELVEYAHIDSDPDIGATQGWIGADLMIQGLKLSGSNPTRASFIDRLRDLKDYTAGGLAAGPINFSEFGTGDVSDGGNVCSYIVAVQGDAFRVVKGGDPLCGKVIRKD